MAVHAWTLIDRETNTNIVGLEVTPQSCGLPSGNWSVKKRTLHGGLSEGVDLVEIDNGLMKLAILPTRGMGIWEAWKGTRTLGWNSPVRGPVHPAFVPLAEPSGWGWLSGFDELMCRCGLLSNGAPDFDDEGRLAYPLHGHVANLPAYKVELSIDDFSGIISLAGYVEDARFHHHKLRLYSVFSTQFDSSSFQWHDTVVNYGGTPTGMQMLYHTNIGVPQLTPGSHLLAPVHRVAPMDQAAAPATRENWQEYVEPREGYQRVYLFDLLADGGGQTQVLLENAEGTSAVGLRFNKSELPYFAQWKNLVSPADGYVTGLEPATNFPFPRSEEERAGRIVTLQPGQKWEATVGLDWMNDSTEIAEAENTIAELQGDHEPIVLASAEF